MTVKGWITFVFSAQSQTRNWGGSPEKDSGGGRKNSWAAAGGNQTETQSGLWWIEWEAGAGKKGVNHFSSIFFYILKMHLTKNGNIGVVAE